METGGKNLEQNYTGSVNLVVRECSIIYTSLCSFFLLDTNHALYLCVCVRVCSFG